MNTIPTLADIFEERFYAKGYAVCQHDIINDTVYFKFRQEEYEIPSRHGHKLVHPGWEMLQELGYKFDAAKIEEVRAMAQRMNHGLRRLN